jgi:hypothetical protein
VAIVMEQSNGANTTGAGYAASLDVVFGSTPASGNLLVATVTARE